MSRGKDPGDSLLAASEVSTPETHSAEEIRR